MLSFKLTSSLHGRVLGVDIGALRLGAVGAGALRLGAGALRLGAGAWCLGAGILCLNACDSSKSKNELVTDNIPAKSAQAASVAAAIAPVAQAPKAQVESRVDALPYYDGPSFEPHWFKSDAPELASFHSIAPFELIDQDGKKVDQSTFEGKIYITDFFFTTCPGICLKLTKNMAELQKELSEEAVLFLSHTVTPEIDTPEILKAYAKKHGVRSGKWHLVTGDRKAIYDLGRKQYFIEENFGKEKSEDDFLHTENFLLIDTAKRIRGIYNGLNRADMRQLIADAKTLLHEEGSENL